MKRILIAITSLLFLGGASLAQNATPGNEDNAPPTPTAQQPSQTRLPDSQSPSATSPRSADSSTDANAGPRIAPGSILPVQLTKTIDAKKIKSGDEVITQVTQDLKTNSGEVIVPKGTKVLGSVTSAQPRSKEQKESEVTIAFNRAVFKSGSEVKMPLSIQAIIGPQNNNPSNASGSSGNDQPAGAVGGAVPTSNGGRPAGMGGNTAAAPVSNQPTTGNESTTGPSNADNRSPITASTQGVIGISNLKLAATSDSAQGSLLSSEKNNVKLESGTMILLRVGQ